MSLFGISIKLILFVAAFILALVALYRSTWKDLTAWAVFLLSLGLALR